MKNIPVSIPAVLAFSLALLPAITGLSQTGDPFAADPAELDSSSSVPPEEDFEEREVVPLDAIRFDADFADLPATEVFERVAEWVENQGGEPLNIVVSESAESIVLPPMSLREISFDQFVSFINRIGGAVAPDAKAVGSFPSDGRTYFPAHSGPRFGLSEINGLWYFWTEEAASRTTPPAGPSEAAGAPGEAAEDLGSLPGAVTTVIALEGSGRAEATLGLIEEAIGEFRRHSNVSTPLPTLKYHEPSCTLIVSASIPEMEMIEEALRVLEARDAKESQSNTPKLNDGIRKLPRDPQTGSRQAAADEMTGLSPGPEREIEALKTELDHARRVSEEFQPRIDELEKKLAKALEALNERR